MTDKYRNAILNYEQARLAVIDSTKKISEVERCLNPSDNGEHPLADRCLDDLYKIKNHNRRIDENRTDCPFCSSKGDEYYTNSLECICEEGDWDHQEETPICENCQKLDEAIQHRKKCKKDFGVAKRALSTIARFELKKIQDDAP